MGRQPCVALATVRGIAAIAVRSMQKPSAAGWRPSGRDAAGCETPIGRRQCGPLRGRPRRTVGGPLRIPVKPITHSGRNRSPVPVETDHPFRPKPITRSERAARDLNHESRFSRFFSPSVSGVIAWSLPSCRVVDMVFVSAGTERREGSTPVGRGRPRALPDSMKKDDGLWALWETALFAVFQALWARSLRP